jgi:Tfp pilus assembly protein PilV
MVTMAILSVAMLAVLALAATARRTGRQAELSYQASVLAQNLLEREKSKSFTELTVGGPTAIPPEELSSDLPYVKAERTVTDVEGFGGNLKEIVIKVSWSEPGREKSRAWMIRISDMPR